MHAQAAAPNWTFDSYISVPYKNTVFLAQDSKGDLYGTTFNNSPHADTVVAFRITDPAGNSPQVQPIDFAQVPTFRGYAGIAADEAGNVYLSVDAGDGAASYVKKLLPGGKPDATFGKDGVVSEPGVRYQGLAMAGDRLIAGQSWGRFAVLDTKTGRKLGETPAQGDPNKAPTIRDIAIVPSSQEILGVDRDAVYVFAGGSLDNPSGYSLKPLVPGNGTQAAGQGIFYDAPNDRIYYARTGLGHLGTSSKSQPAAEVIETVGTTPGGPLSNPADAVISPDGRFLFCSDSRAPVIMRYRSSADGSTLAAVPHPDNVSPKDAPPTSVDGSVVTGAVFTAPVPPATSSTIAAAPIAPLNGKAVAGGATADASPQGGSTANSRAGTFIEWESGDLRRALSKAYAGKRRLVAFFTDPDVPLAQQVEKQLFDTAGFAAKYPDALFLRLTLSADRTDVQRYGVYRVPTVIFFSGTGQESARLSGNISATDFAAAYAASADPTAR
jgi:hypothetical protein